MCAREGVQRPRADADSRKSRMKKLCFPTILWLTVLGPQGRPDGAICPCTHTERDSLWTESRGGAGPRSKTAQVMAGEALYPCHSTYDQVSSAYTDEWSVIL